MGPAELVRACLDEMRDSDGFAVAGDVAETHRVALLGTVGVAAVLIGYALGVHDSDRDRSLDLFEVLIRGALQDEEGSGRIGARFLDEAARAMRLPAVTDRLDPPATHDLARAYARAGAEAPPELVQHLIGQMDELTKSGRLPFDPDSEIERMRPVLDLDEHYLHRKLDERIGTLPEELRAAFAYEVACRDEAVCGRIGMYWLLDGSAEVRLGAAEGFRERAQREIVEPVSAALVPLIRNWMPADAGRTLLDEALAEARRRELVAPLPRPERRRAGNLRFDPRQVGHADAARGSARRGRTGPRDGRYGIGAGDRRGRGHTGHGSDRGVHGVGRIRHDDRDPLGNVPGAGCRGAGRRTRAGEPARRGAGRRRALVRDVGVAAACDDRAGLVV